MLHAAAMLLGLFIIGLIALQRPLTPEIYASAAVMALLSVAVALRFGGAGRTLFSAPHVLALMAQRAGAVLRGALGTMRAAAAADVTLNPALVRIKTRAAGAYTNAVLADTIGAAPGAAIVDADDEGMLLHVLDEDDVDAVELGAIEARALAALEAGGRG